MGKIIDHNNFWYIEKNPISKTGVFPYLGREIGYPGLEPNKIYYVLRSEQELMSPEAIKSFELLPITKGHRMLGPQEQGLTPAEKIPQQGVVGEKVFAEGDTLYANIKVTSEQAKNDINNGLKELSLGYFCRWVKEAGEYKGQHYDFAQKNIRGNHLAIVPLGRMGHDVRVMDALPQNAPSYACDSLELAGPFVSALLPAGHIPLKLFSLPEQAQDWQESDHPRKKDGKFAPKGQGESGKANDPEAAEIKAETPKQTQNASEKQQTKEEKYNSPAVLKSKEEVLSKAVELTEGKAPVADIKNNEFDGADVPAKRQAAKRYYIDNLKGHAFKNKNSGQKIIIGDEGKTFSQTGYEDKINSFKYLPDILERSEYLGKDEDINGRKDIKAFHYYGGQVNTPDGKQLLIMSVRELKDGDFYYNHHITRKQSSKSTPVLPSGTKTTAKDSIAKEEQQIKGDLKMDKKLSEMSITEMLESAEDEMNLFIEEAEETEDLKTNGTDGISAAPEDKESIKMDKRKVIEEIMAIAAKPADEFKDGKEEQIKTIAGLAEKLAYNKSERGANDEDAAKDKAKDEDNPSKTDKDADKKAKEVCDKADKAEDAMEARIAANFAKKAALYEKVSPFTGSFDHNPMTLSQMAKYACDKLGIKGIAEDGAETALEGYLVGAQKQAVVREEKDAACDAFPVSDPAFKKYLEEAQ